MPGPRSLLGRLMRAAVIAVAVAAVRDRLIAHNQAKYGFEPLAKPDRAG